MCPAPVQAISPVTQESDTMLAAQNGKEKEGRGWDDVTSCTLVRIGLHVVQKKGEGHIS